MSSRAAAQPLVYVANSADAFLSVIDTAANEVVATIGVGLGPFDIVPSPLADIAYVTNQCGDDQMCQSNGTVSVVDLETRTTTTTIPVGRVPVGIAITPDGSRVYAANQFTNDVSVIDTATNTVIATVVVDATPVGVAVTDDGRFVYVTNACGTDPDNCFNVSVNGTVSVISTADNTLVDTVTVGFFPVDASISHAGDFVFISNAGFSSTAVSVIRAADNAVIDTFDLGRWPASSASTPDGNVLYVANAGDNTVSIVGIACPGDCGDDGQVTVDELVMGVNIALGNGDAEDCSAFDPNNNGSVSIDELVAAVNAALTACSPAGAVIGAVTVGNLPNDIAFTTDGRFAYVANRQSLTVRALGDVSVIDVASGAVVATIAVGNNPSRLAIH